MDLHTVSIALGHLCYTEILFIFSNNPISQQKAAAQSVAHDIWKETKDSPAILCVSRGALSCWGQQVGFLPCRDDTFYNEEVKEIIMEINSWAAVACELYQAELWISRAGLQCRAEKESLT